MKFIKISINLLTLGVLSLLICEIPAKRLRSSFNSNVDPCENFYKSACTSRDAQKNVDKPERLKKINVLNCRTYSLDDKIPDFTNEPEFVKQAYIHYESCRNVKEYEPIKYLQRLASMANSGLSSLLPAAKRKQNEFHWVKTLAIYRKYGLNDIFIKENINHKKDDPIKILIDLSKPEISEDIGLTGYGLILAPIVESMLFKSSRKYSEFEWKLYRFENKLKKLMFIDDDDVQHLITVQELPFKWLKTYLSVLLNQAELDTNMSVYISNVKYMRALDKLLSGYGNEFLNEYLEMRFLKFLRKRGPWVSFRPHNCQPNTNNLIPLAKQWMSEEEYPDLKEDIPKIHEMFEIIRQQFAKILKRNKNDFSSTILEFLEAKLENLKLKVGQFEDILAVEKIYENLGLSSDDFYGNYLKLLNLNFKASHSRLNPTLSEKSIMYILDEFEHDIDIDFDSDYKYSLINLPLDEIQQDSTHNLKYSYLGVYMAKKLFYHFSSRGLEYDSNGNYNIINRDNISSNSQFYDNYTCLNKTDTFWEHEYVAAFNGFKLVYEQFFENYSNDLINLRKLFFLNFGQSVCDYGDSLNDILAHFEEFPKIFQCSDNSRMNSEKKCAIWG